MRCTQAPSTFPNACLLPRSLALSHNLFEPEQLGAADFAGDGAHGMPHPAVRKQPEHRRTAKRWSRLEEAVLASLVDKHGEGAWDRISREMVERSAGAVEQVTAPRTAPEAWAARARRCAAYSASTCRMQTLLTTDVSRVASRLLTAHSIGK